MDLGDLVLFQCLKQTEAGKLETERLTVCFDILIYVTGMRDWLFLALLEKVRNCDVKTEQSEAKQTFKCY